MNSSKSYSNTNLQELNSLSNKSRPRNSITICINEKQMRTRSSTLNSIDSLNINSIESIRFLNTSPKVGKINETSTNSESPTYLLSELLNNFSSVKERDEYFIVSKGNDLILLLNQYPNLKNDIVIKSFINKIQFMFFHQVSEVRAIGYKILRYIIFSYECLTVIVQSKILIFLIVTMSSDYSSMLEKEEALKLIRQFLVIPKGADNLSIGVLKSLISLIETDDSHISESFKNVCVETICEIALLKPELIFHSGGFKVIINTILDASDEMSSNCLLVLIKILDFKDSRKFLRNGYDLNSIIACFSNSDDIKKTSIVKLQKTSFLITILLKNFNGLISFSMNNFKILNDFLLNLRKRNFKLRDIILDVLFDVLRIKCLPWLQNSSIGEAIKNFNNQYYSKNSNFTFSYPNLNKQNIEFNLINHYLGLLVLILINNNLIPLLIEIIEENYNESNTKKATILLTHILTMANILLPTELYNNDLLLPSTLNNSLLFSSIFKIENSIKNQNKNLAITSNLRTYIKNINIRSRYDIDDFEFKNLINNTRILTIKEFEEWNWNILLSLIQGPLRNSKRFDEILEKNPKFLKRLMSFYRPFKFRFCNISMSNKNSKQFINLGCQLLETLLYLDNGVKYLSSNKLLPQLSEIFAQVDPYSGVSAKDPILSRKRLEHTLSIGYVKFIGILSANNNGIKILEQWQFFNSLQNIIEDSSINESNNYLIMNLFKSLDFSIDSQFRIILSKSLNISNLSIKLFLIDKLIPNLINIKECENFIIKLVVNKLYEPNPEILHKAICLLDNYYLSNDFRKLNYFINLKPSIKILSKSNEGKNILFNCLRISKGFKYLEDSGFIDIEFNNWLNLSNFDYLSRIENLIHSSFFPYISSTNTTSNDVSTKFFNYLLSTEEGLNYFSNFKQKAYLDRLMSEIDSISKQLNNLDDDFDIQNDDSQTFLINLLKQNLWIIGDIASSKFGIQLLDPIYNISLSNSIIGIILDLFYNCSIWQIRSICFYVLGMISSTIEGMEILDELNWISVIDEYSKSKCLTYPNCSINTIFNAEYVNPYRDIKYYSIFNGPNNENELFYEIDESNIFNYEKINEKVLSLINHLNSVLGKIERKSIKELLKIKKDNPEVFENLNLFLEVIRLVDKSNYKFHKRKFIFELFLKNTKVLENLIKRDRKSLVKG